MQKFILLLLLLPFSATAGKVHLTETGWSNGRIGCWTAVPVPKDCGWLAEIGSTKRQFFKFTLYGVRGRVLAINTTTTMKNKIDEQYVIELPNSNRRIYVYFTNDVVTAVQD